MLPDKADHAISCSVADLSTTPGVAYYGAWQGIDIPADGFHISMIESEAYAEGDPLGKLNFLWSLVGTLQLADDAGIIDESLSVATSGKKWGVGTPGMWTTMQGFPSLSRDVTKCRAKMVSTGSGFNGSCSIVFGGNIRRFFVGNRSAERDWADALPLRVKVGDPTKQMTKFRYKIQNTDGGEQGWAAKFFGEKLYRFTED